MCSLEKFQVTQEYNCSVIMNLNQPLSFKKITFQTTNSILTLPDYIQAGATLALLTMTCEIISVSEWNVYEKVKKKL